MPERVLRNWPLKLLALGLAIGIWIWVSGEARRVRQFDVPLDIIVQSGHTLSAPAPSTVLVRLSGPETMMRRVDEPSMTMVVDLREFDVGRQEILLAPDDLVGGPGGATVELIEPNRLTLTLETRAERTLPVEPVFLGEPPDGFTFYGASVRPEEVRVAGPDQQVMAMETIRTTPIRLDRRTASFDLVVRLVPEVAMVSPVDPRPVQVRVEIDADPASRTFEGLPIRVRGRADLVRARTGQVAVVLSGPPAVLEALRADQLTAYVRAPETIDPGGSTRARVGVDWSLPTGDGGARLSVVEVRPPTVTLVSTTGESQR